MDKIERKLLNIVQGNFPVESRPYLRLGEMLGVGEEEALRHMKRLYDLGIVRRLGGVFDSRRLGYFSTLCAAKIPPDKISLMVGILADIPGVTHNYLREHEYNMWFTLIAPSKEEGEEILANVRRTSGIDTIYSLPALRLFKIRVDFDLSDGDGSPGREFKAGDPERDNRETRPEREEQEEPGSPHEGRALAKSEGWGEQGIAEISEQQGTGDEEFPESGEEKFEVEVPEPLPSEAAGGADFSDEDRALVKALQLDLPHMLRPFAHLAETLGWNEAQVLERTVRFLEEGIMRRFGAILRHQKAGFTANAMGVWRVNEDQAAEVGEKMAEFREVSHCYQRPTLPDWPYNIFTMVHGRTEDDCRRIMEKISAATGLPGYKMLFSTVELKKSSMQYFVED